MKKLLPIAATLVAGVATLSACGASDDSTTTASASDTAACKTAVAAAVEADKAEPTFSLPDTTIDAAKASGKSVWVINVLSNELTTNFTNGIEKAAEAAGVDFEKLDGSGSTQTSNQLINTALGAGAGAIVMDGIDPSSVTGPLEKAKEQGVPVVTIISGVIGASNPLIYGDVTVDETKMGQTYADYALDYTGCDLHLGSIALPKSFNLNYTIDKTTKAEVAKQCPSCKVDTVEMDLANLATATPTQVQSLIKRNPDINYLAIGFDAVAPYVGPAASQVNPKIKMIGNNGLSANMKDVMDGGVQNADLTYPPNEYVGWLTFDKVLSAWSGNPGGNTAIPLRLVDKSNIGDGDLTKLFPSWDGYEAAFTQHWGL